MSENFHHQRAGRMEFDPSTDDFVNDMLSNAGQFGENYTTTKTSKSSFNSKTIKADLDNAESLFKIYNDSCSNILPNKERLKNLSWRLLSMNSTHGQLCGKKGFLNANVAGNITQKNEEHAETLKNENLLGAEHGLFSPLNSFHEQLHDGSFSSPDISIQGKAFEKFTTISPGNASASHHHDHGQNIGNDKNIDDLMEVDTQHLDTLSGSHRNLVEPQPSFSHELDYVNQLKTINSETGIDPSYLEPQTTFSTNEAQPSPSTYLNNMDSIIRTGSISNFANAPGQDTNNNNNFDHHRLSTSIADSFLPHSSFSNPMQHVGFLNSSKLSRSMNEHETLIDENGIDDDDDEDNDDESSTPGSATFGLNPNKIISNLSFGVNSMREPGAIDNNNAVGMDQFGRRNLNSSSAMSRSPSVGYSFANNVQTPLLSGSAPLGTEGSFMPSNDKNSNIAGSFSTGASNRISEPIGIKRMNSSNSLLKQKSFTNIHSLPSKNNSFLSTGSITSLSATSQPKDQTEFHSIDFRPNSLPRQGGIRKKQDVIMNSKSRRSSMSTSAGAAVFNHTPTPPPQSAESSSSPLATNRRGPSKAMKAGRATGAKTANKEKNAASNDNSSGSKDPNKDIECTNCHTKTTPLWRRDPMGKPLCNACGLFLKLHGVVRPLSLKSDVIKKRQRNNNTGSTIGAASQDDKVSPDSLNSKSKNNISKASKGKKATDSQGKSSKTSPTSRRGRPPSSNATRSKNQDSTTDIKDENSTTQHTFSFENFPNSSDFFDASMLSQKNSVPLMSHNHDSSTDTIVRDEKIVDKSIRGLPIEESHGIHDDEIVMKSSDVMNATVFDQHELFFGHEQNLASTDHDMSGHLKLSQSYQEHQFIQQRDLAGGTTDVIDIFSGFPNNQDFNSANTDIVSDSISAFSSHKNTGVNNEHITNVANQPTQLTSSSNSRSPSSSATSHTNFHNGFWNSHNQSQTSNRQTMNESSATQTPVEPPTQTSRTKSAETKNLEWLTLSLWI